MRNPTAVRPKRTTEGSDRNADAPMLSLPGRYDLTDGRRGGDVRVFTVTVIAKSSVTVGHSLSRNVSVGMSQSVATGKRKGAIEKCLQKTASGS